MLLENARDLKAALTQSVVESMAETGGAMAHSFALGATPIESIDRTLPSMAIGIQPKKGNQFQIAVRCQRRELMDGKEVDAIKKKAKNEVDVQFIGRLRKRATPWYQKKVRPLQIGISCGHFKITAGTLGCFVKLRSDATGAIHILSNNHVLANENKSKKGDAILQPGHFDGGTDPADMVAALAAQVKLKKTTNLVDAAIAKIAAEIKCDLKSIKGLGNLAGLGPQFLDEGTIVAKLGRTTGLTRGRVTAFELDNVVVSYDLGNLRFDNQIEIEGADDDAFSAGGDSGSLIVEESTRLAVALLFAGGDTGGQNGKGLTFANPIHAVLDALKIDLA